MSSSSGIPIKGINELKTLVTAETDAIDASLVALGGQITADTDAIDASLVALGGQITADTDAIDASLVALGGQVTADTDAIATQNATDKTDILAGINGLQTPRPSLVSWAKNMYLNYLIVSHPQAVSILCGALTSGIYKSVLSVAGSGEVNFLSHTQLVGAGGATRNNYCKLIIDGIETVHQFSSNGTAGLGNYVIGNNDNGYIPDTIYFNTSFEVQVMQDLITVTDDVKIQTIYKVF